MPINQLPKHVVLPYVENNLYSNNKYSSVRRLHTLYIGYFTEHSGDNEPHDYDPSGFVMASESSNRLLPGIFSGVLRRPVLWAEVTNFSCKLF